MKLAYSEEDSTHYAMKILSKRKLLRKAGLMGRGPKKGTSPLDRVYREIAVLKKVKEGLIAIASIYLEKKKIFLSFFFCISDEFSLFFIENLN